MEPKIGDYVRYEGDPDSEIGFSMLPFDRYGIDERCSFNDDDSTGFK